MDFIYAPALVGGSIILGIMLIYFALEVECSSAPHSPAAQEEPALLEAPTFTASVPCCFKEDMAMATSHDDASAALCSENVAGTRDTTARQCAIAAAPLATLMPRATSV